ncbi:MAG: hypothetical protein AAF291_11080 [Pseudomonadota bacterium]
MTTSKFKQGTLAALSFAIAGSLAMTASVAEAKKGPKSTAASASAKKPVKQRRPGESAGSTQGSATSSSTRPNTFRDRVGYILTSPRRVSFKLPTKTDRTAASTLRRDGRGNQITKLGSATIDKRSATKSGTLEAKQAQRAKPRINPTSTADLKSAAARGFQPTAASRGAVRAGAAPIGSGQVQNPDRQWGALAAQTVQRNGSPQPEKPGFFRRLIDGFKGLFRR